MKKQTSTAAVSLSQLTRGVSQSISSAGPAGLASPAVGGEEAPTASSQPQADTASCDSPTPELHVPTDGVRHRRRTTSSSSQPATVSGMHSSSQPGMDIEEIAEVTEPVDAEVDEEGEAGEQCEGEPEEVEKKTTWKDSFKNAGMFFYELFYSSVVSLINLLNMMTFEHYLVRRRLKRQMEIQKISNRRAGIIPGEVTRRGHRKQGSTASALSVGGAIAASGPVPSLAVPAAGTAINRASSFPSEQFIPHTYIHEDLTEEDEIKEREEIENELRSHSLLYRLIRAFFDLLLARTEFVCYLLMVLTFLLEGSILSLPLPLLAFSWGMLAIPAPGHRFWITVMTYEMLVVIVKFIFQFPLGLPDANSMQPTPGQPWSTYNDAAKLFGVHKRSNFALLDSILLVALFLHRFMLKRYGLWKPAETTPLEKPGPISPSANQSARVVSEQSRSDSTGKKSGLIVKRKSSPRQNVTAPPQLALTPADSEQAAFLEPTEDVDDDLGFIDDDFEAGLEMEVAISCFGNFCNRIKSVPSLVVQFFTQLTNPEDRAPRDLYAFMFASDFLALLTTVFAYDKFGPSSYKAQAVIDLLQSDAVPIPFVILLLVQFSFLLIDRALYIRKLAVGKLVFQIFLLILVHVITLFVLPLPTVTNIPFSQNAAVQVWYFFKCAYFAFSAYQIKFGYPQHVATHFLTKQYNYLMWILLKGFMVIPFLLELRTILDWVFTRTTLSFRYWLFTDLCYYEVFSIKCERRMEEKYPTTRGTPRPWLLKLHGLLYLAAIVFILWFPFLLFSFGDLMVMPAEMNSVRLEIKLSGSSNQPIFAYSVDNESGNLYKIDKKRYDKLSDCFKKINQQLVYTEDDVWIAKIGTNSQSLWTMSPPAYDSLASSLQDPNLTNMSVSSIFSVIRKTSATSRGSVSPEYRNKVLMTNQTRSDLLEILDDSRKPNINATGKVNFANLVPQYLVVDRSGALDVFQLPNCPEVCFHISSYFYAASFILFYLFRRIQSHLDRQCS